MAVLEVFELEELLRVDFDKGLLYWKTRDLSYFKNFDIQRCNTWNSKFAEQRAFTAECGGYYQGQILGEMHYAHRVIWALHTGEWPENEIDHKDRNGFNNIISNLRDVTHIVNMSNRWNSKDGL